MTKQDSNAGKQVHEILDFIGSLVLKGGDAVRSFRDEVLADLDERLKKVAKSVGEGGTDPFGMEPAALRRAAVGAAFLYKTYFRCTTRGIENIPAGPVILVANHAGQLPIDGVMITTALLLKGDPPRLPRSMMDRWVPSLPFISTFFSRMGVVVGAPENAERLLARKEALLVFPEGMKAITKTVDQAYQLQEFGSGFMRLALASRTPIVPVAVVGSEEQYPTLYNLKNIGKLLGLPSLPIWLQMFVPVLGLLPLPVRYRLHFGEAMRFEGDPDDDDQRIGDMVQQVSNRLKELIDAMLSERKSVFW